MLTAQGGGGGSALVCKGTDGSADSGLTLILLMWRQNSQT